MRKEELVHTHALLREVTRYLIENENMSAEMVSAYEGLDVRPPGIHKSKQQHYEAITVLGNSIEWWLEPSHSNRIDCPVN